MWDDCRRTVQKHALYWGNSLFESIKFMDNPKVRLWDSVKAACMAWLAAVSHELDFTYFGGLRADGHHPVPRRVVVLCPWWSFNLQPHYAGLRPPKGPQPPGFITEQPAFIARVPASSYSCHFTNLPVVHQGYGKSAYRIMPYGCSFPTEIKRCCSGGCWNPASEFHLSACNPWSSALIDYTTGKKHDDTLLVQQVWMPLWV